MICYVRPALRRRLASALVVVAIAGCGPAATASPASNPVATPSAELASSSPADAGSVVLVGRIVTMDDPPIAEALFIEDGTVAAVGTRDEVLALAGDQVRVIDLGQNVAYPGFIDAHAHWIGDRELLRPRDRGRSDAGRARTRLDLDLRAVGEPGAAQETRNPWPPTTPSPSAWTPTSP